MTDRTPTGDLRERLADALRAETCPTASHEVHGDVLDVADAVLPVVEAETADLRRALAHRHGEWQRELDARIAAEQKLQDAERQRDESRRESAEANFTIGRQTAALATMQKAERQRDEALAALREFVDDRPCDPHPGNGFCQTHGEKAPCPHAAAKKLLALDQPEGTP